MLALLRRFIASDGPNQAEYAACDTLFDALHESIAANDLSQDDLLELSGTCQSLNDTESVMGHSRQKPLGYSGDFQIIERINNWRVSEKHRKWDTYAMSRPAAIAIRNRKTYFKNLLINRLPDDGNVLNLGSGAARDHYEYCIENPESRVVATCVEMEGKALDFARYLNRDYQNRIHFVEENVFEFKTMQTYNLVWVGSLCDYLMDDQMIRLLQSCKKWLKPDGELVVGNFNADNNPTRSFMEIFGHWHIQHRTKAQLLEIASQAGFSSRKITLDNEPLGINLFLHARL